MQPELCMYAGGISMVSGNLYWEVESGQKGSPLTLATRSMLHVLAAFRL